MAVLSVGEDHKGYYQGYTAETDRSQKPFVVEKPEEIVNEEPGREEVPDAFKGKSIKDLLAASGFKGNLGNQIPVINRIVSAQSPEDGKIYRTYFMDDKIFCNDAEGKRAWEIDIDGSEQLERVNSFFKKYASNGRAEELYSGKDMGRAVLESFWRDLFERS